jgi:hypothetical protein
LLSSHLEYRFCGNEKKKGGKEEGGRRKERRRVEVSPTDQIINHQLLNPSIICDPQPTQTPQRTKSDIIIAIIIVRSKQLSSDSVDDRLCVLAADEVAARGEAGHVVAVIVAVVAVVVVGTEVDVEMFVKLDVVLDETEWVDGWRPQWESNWYRDRDGNRDVLGIGDWAERLDGKCSWRNGSWSTVNQMLNSNGGL